jgi:hypothetical protein
VFRIKQKFSSPTKIWLHHSWYSRSKAPGDHDFAQVMFRRAVTWAPIHFVLQEVSKEEKVKYEFDSNGT